ncbi:MAG: hypothetical protein ACYS15_13075 [Planctomycetota bacterium]|jgi:hypothetical protein
MNDPRTDAIAREAARLIQSSRASSIGEAIRVAADMLGIRDAELPGHGRVRKHAQALSMQALGDVGYADSVRRVWQVAERVMTVLDQAMPRADPLLVGRAAQGRIDGGVTVHVRLYTDAPIGDVAAALVEFGYDEPSFETANTRLGRLNRVRLEDDGLELVLTRCLPSMAGSADRDLFSGRPITTATLAQVRRKLAES